MRARGRPSEAVGYDDGHDPVFIQSFEVGNLKKLARMTRLPLVQLTDAAGKSWDFVLNNGARTYADLAKPAGLAEIAKTLAASGRTRA